MNPSTDTLHYDIRRAVCWAEAGAIVVGYDLLLRGRSRAFEALAEGDPDAAELVRGYLKAIAAFEEAFGVRFG